MRLHSFMPSLRNMDILTRVFCAFMTTSVLSHNWPCRQCHAPLVHYLNLESRPVFL